MVIDCGERRLTGRGGVLTEAGGGGSARRPDLAEHTRPCAHGAGHGRRRHESLSHASEPDGHSGHDRRLRHACVCFVPAPGTLPRHHPAVTDSLDPNCSPGVSRGFHPRAEDPAQSWPLDFLHLPATTPGGRTLRNAQQLSCCGLAGLAGRSGCQGGPTGTAHKPGSDEISCRALDVTTRYLINADLRAQSCQTIDSLSKVKVLGALSSAEPGFSSRSQILGFWSVTGRRSATRTQR